MTLETKKTRSHFGNEVFLFFDSRFKPSQKIFCAHATCRDFHCYGDALGLRTVQLEAAKHKVQLRCVQGDSLIAVDEAVILD